MTTVDSFAYFTDGPDRNDLAAARRRSGLSSKALACARPPAVRPL